MGEYYRRFEWRWAEARALFAACADQAIWKSDPRLVESVALRLEAVKARQMLGYLPDGTKVVPMSPEQAD